MWTTFRQKTQSYSTKGKSVKGLYIAKLVSSLFIWPSSTLPFDPPIAENEKHVFSILMIQVALFATSILKLRIRGQRCNATADDDPLFYTTI